MNGNVRDEDTLKVVIAGGGVAALEAALTLNEIARHQVDVHLVAPEPHFWYRPAAVAEPFGVGSVTHVELTKLAAAGNATFALGSIKSVDSAAGRAYYSDGTAHDYDALLIACGARSRPAVEGALTFRGPADVEKFGLLLEEIDAGLVRRLAFVVPWGAAWVLPAYELALMTAARAASSRIDVEIALVTPEAEPLQLFGGVASATIRDLLDERGVAFHAEAVAEGWRDGELVLGGSRPLKIDRAVALPRLYGERIDGVPHTVDGFIPVDEHCRVRGLTDVFAAGDITDYPVKQGGIASEAARAAAEAIAALTDDELRPNPFHPVLRGMLLTGAAPQYLRKDLTDEAPSWATTSPVWWPPTKVVGRYLAPAVASVTRGVDIDLEGRAAAEGVEVEIDLGELDSTAVERLAVRRFESRRTDGHSVGAGRTVGDVMHPDPLAAAPEDTIGELAERMRERDAGSALVLEFGRLVGIITTRDLLRALAARMHSSEARVRQWMTAAPLTATRAMPVDEAGGLMAEYGIHHLPVLDGDRAIGMVGTRDVSTI